MLVTGMMLLRGHRREKKADSCRMSGSPLVLSFPFRPPLCLQCLASFHSSFESGMASSSASSVASASSDSSSLQPEQVTASAVLRALSEGSPTEGTPTPVSKEIEDLLETQRQVRAQRAKVGNELKNAQRRKQRLKHKARLLTAADLASVLVLRQEEEENQKHPKRRRSSQPDATPRQASGKDAVVGDGQFEDEEDDTHEQDPREAASDGREGEERTVA